MAVSRRMWLREQERKKRERERRARRRRNIAITVFLLTVIVVAVIVIRGSGSGETVKVDDPEVTAASEQIPQPGAVQTAEIYSGTQEEITVDADYFDNSVFIGNALAAGIDKYGMLPYTDFYAGVHITLENMYTTAANNSSMAVIDQLKSQKFSKVFISFGQTELSWGDASKFSKAYKEMLGKVRSYQQSANIYIISIPPVAETASVAGTGYALSTIKSYNKELKIIAAQEKMYYVDSFAALGGNYLPSGVSSDGVNLNRTYYAKLLNYAREKAEIPKLADISDDDDDDIESEASDVSYSTEKPGTGRSNVSGENDDEPQPTVNVFKNSGSSG